MFQLLLLFKPWGSTFPEVEQQISFRGSQKNIYILSFICFQTLSFVSIPIVICLFLAMSVTTTQLINETSMLRAQGQQDDYVFLRCKAADIPIESRNFLSQILSNGLTSEQDVEYTFPASPLQRDILAFEETQWCSVDLPLPYTSFNPIDRINSSWHTLALHCE